MALAEARAAWQRTANRCLVQEDAKRAPKLACCSSMPPTVKQADMGPTSTANGQDIPITGSRPFNRTPSYSNLSPNSKWWLHLQPNYGYQKGLIDEQSNSPEGNMEVDSCPIGQTTYNPCRNFASCDKNNIRDYEEEEFGSPKVEVNKDIGEKRDEIFVGYEVSKHEKELYFDSKSSERNAPWWRTADTEELAYLVAQRSHELIENCDLPMPQNARAKKDPNVNICRFGHHEITKIPVDPKLGSVNHDCFSSHDCTPGSLILVSACPKLRMSVEGQLMSGPDKQSRESPAVINTFENDTSKARLLEALHHSQTRAREAEKAAKQAYSEKEQVVKLVFRQASQLFAYKQWLQLLQLENMYFHFKNNKSRSVSNVFPLLVPLTLQRTRKMRKNWQKSSRRKWVKRTRGKYDVGKYAVVFALGLGLIGAGLLLGWSVGWIYATNRVRCRGGGSALF